MATAADTKMRIGGFRGRLEPKTDARMSIFKTVGRWNLPARSRASALRTATPVANGVIWRHLTVSSEFGSPLLNGLQRSVNRKVQGSNPWSGAILPKNRASIENSGQVRRFGP